MENNNQSIYITIAVAFIVILGLIFYLESIELGQDDVNATVDARVALVLTDANFDATNEAQQQQFEALVATDESAQLQASTELAQLAELVSTVEEQSTVSANNISGTIEAQANAFQTEIASINPTATPTPNDPFFLAPIQISLDDDTIASNFVEGDFGLMEFSPDHTAFVVDALGENGREARLYNVDDLTSYEILPIISTTIADFAWSHDASRIGVSVSRAPVYVFDIQTLELISRIDTSVSHIEWSGNGQYLLGRESSILYVWNPEDGERLDTFFLEGGNFRDIFVNPSNNQVWTFENRNVRKMTIRPNGTLSDLIYSTYSLSGNIATFNPSPDGQLIATSESVSSNILIWTARRTNDTVLNEFDRDGLGITAISWSPNSQFLANFSDDNSIQIWYVDDGILIYDLSSEASVEDIAWFNDGTLAVSTSEGLYILDLNLDTTSNE